MAGGYHLSFIYTKQPYEVDCAKKMIETNSPGGFQGQVGTPPTSSPNANYNAMLAMTSL